MSLSSDLNVEMKNSGIEWIYNIPKHWKIKIKHIGYLKSGDGFKIELQGNQKVIFLSIKFQILLRK